jgi:HAE1 family hydrophobic/amphiphilic exporter-1
MFSRFFVHRPVFAGVISIVLMILGAISYVTLPVEQYPELAPPVVRVEARFPGANARIITDAVASPIEQEINGVDRMLYMSSTSVDGLYQLDVSFEPGTNIDIAAVMVQNRVSAAEAKLPEEVQRLGVTTKKQSTAFVGVLALYSPDESYDTLFLSNYATINLKDELSRIFGVGGVLIIPAQDYGMRIWLDPNRLRARGLTVNEIRAAIAEQNVQVAAGAVGKPPAPEGTDFELVVNTLGRLSTPEQFQDIIVKTSNDGLGVVRLRDVARVELGASDYSQQARFNGKPGAIIIVYQLPGANLTATADAIQAKLDELRTRFPAGVEAKLFYDAAQFVRASQHEVVKTLIEAFALVAVVVLVFLQSWRTALIPLITIPVSLIATFAVMNILGFSINTLTMFGLVLAIGIVVDDAIVVVENVEAKLAHPGITARDATIKAMTEIFGAIIAITLVLMCVFLPTAALPGLTGSMYQQFALTIAAATFFSAVNALTLSPALCGVLLKPHSHQPPTGVAALLSAPARLFNRGFDALADAYGNLARLSGRAWPVTLLLFAGAIAATGYTFTRVPGGFVPEEDLGFIAVATQLPPGASLERSDTAMARVASGLAEIDGVADVAQMSGFSIVDGQGSSYATSFVVLDSWDERYAKGRDINAIMADINQQIAPVQEGRFFAFSLPPISGLGNTSGQDLRLLDLSNGTSPFAPAVFGAVGAINGQPSVAAAFATFRPGVPQLFLDIDREKAKRFGVSLTDLFATLQTSLGSAYINDFNLFGRTFRVSVQADAPFRLSAQDITRLEVRNSSGQMVPLASLVTVIDSFGPDKITRYNLYPSAQVVIAAKPGASSGVVLSQTEGVMASTLDPRNTGFAWSGMSFQEKLTGNTAVFVFALAILLVYLILAAQYESFVTPLAVVLSVPLVITGAMLALELRGLPNDVFVQIGLVLLVGLGAKNAILIVEFARQNRANGKSLIDSAADAAKTRLRPILMTSFAFILGVVPLVLAEGAGAGGRRALGTAVFGGMVGVTVLGLAFTPALFVVVEWVNEKLFGQRKQRPEAASAPLA